MGVLLCGVWKAHFAKSGGPFLVPTVYPLALFRLRLPLPGQPLGLGNLCGSHAFL